MTLVTKTRLPRRVTVKEEDGKLWGIMVCDTGETLIYVREELPELFRQLDPEKQTYWARRNIGVLEKKMKRELKSRNILDQKIKPSLQVAPVDIVPEGNEVQNG